MAHTTDYSEIYKTPSSGLSMAEVSKCLGEGSLDIGTLCTSAKIKPFARYKPEQSVLLKELVAEDRDAVNHSIVMPPTAPYMNAADLLGSNAKIKYQRPPAGYYRPLDFNGYYNLAPACVAHCTVKNTETVAANTVDDNSAPLICFYLLMNDGWVKWRVPNDASGIGSGSIIPAGITEQFYASKCLAAEDVIPAWFSGEESFFAVALFQNGTYIATHKCTVAIGHYQQDEYGMYKLTVRDGTSAGMIGRPTVWEVGSNQPVQQDIPAGTYQAVACVMRGNRYYPLFPYGTDYTNRFTLKLGGADMYTAVCQGGAFTRAGEPALSLTTSNSGDSQIWLTFTLTDTGYGKATLISQTHLQRLKVTGTIRGKVYDSASSYNINRPFTKLYTDGSLAITIAANGSVTLKFAIDNIWEQSESTPAGVHDSGRITLEDITLMYGSETFTQSAALVGVELT